jgi:putative ABC transport system permease protein
VPACFRYKGAILKNLWQDIRFGSRAIARQPGFAAIIILTLALGIGANTAIFSVVYGVLLRPLPYPQPERIAQISISYNGVLDYSGFNAPEFNFWQAHDQPFAAVAATTGVGFNLSSGNQPLRVHALRVSKDYFRVMGVQPALGREFIQDEDSANGPNVAILGYGLWKSEFGADAGLVGKTILLDGTPYTVVGIMPAGFQNVSLRGDSDTDTELWTTIGQVANSIGRGINYTVIARLKDGVSTEQANSYLSIAMKEFARQFPSQRFSPRNHAAFSAEPLIHMASLGYRTKLLVLFGAIGFVLLIACANVANLLMSRAASRGKEFAIRTALGASRMRMFRQLLTESLVLAIIGGVLGLFVANWGLKLLLALAPTDLPRASAISLDGSALAFTAMVSLLTGVLFGIAPAFQSSKTDINNSLKESVGRATAGLSRSRLRSALAISEIALSLVLLAGAALLVKTFANLLNTNAGFDPRPILTLQTWTTGQKFAATPSKANFFGEVMDAAEISNFYQGIVDKIQAAPGVESAAVVGGGLPLAGGGNVYVWLPSEGESGGLSADFRSISTDYFRTLGIPLLQGRLFANSDSPDAAKVVLINQEFVREKFSKGNPIGQMLNVEGTPRQIVGVVGDVKSSIYGTDVSGGFPVPATVFIPLAQDTGAIQEFQHYGMPVYVVVRTSLPTLSISHAVEDAIHSAKPELPIGHVESMEQVLSKSLSFQRFTMTLMSIFAGLALILATLGIYGVIAYSVTQRTHEIGIRMALGAHPRDVLRMVVRQGMTLGGIGVAIGISGALGTTGFLATQLYGVKPSDPLVLAAVSTALVLIVLLASYLPARRAANADPLVALRYE